MAGSPTQRTLKHLRDNGWLVGITEKWNAYSAIRQDLFGFIDILAVKEGEGVLAIQATSTSNKSARIKKLLPMEAVATCLRAGVAVQVWGWAKRGPRGKRKLWTLSVTELILFDGVVEARG